MKGLYFQSGRKSTTDKEDLKPTVSVEEMDRAFNGEADLELAIKILADKRNYLRIPFMGYLTIISYQPQIAKLVYQDRELHQLLTAHQKTVISMHKTLIRNQFKQKFQLKDVGIAYLQLIEQSEEMPTEAEPLCLTELKQILNGIETPPAPSDSGKPKGFSSESAAQIWVAVAKKSPEAAQRVLNTDDIRKVLTISDLCEIGASDFQVARRLIKGKDYYKVMAEVDLFKLMFNHMAITNYAVQKPKFWKKLHRPSQFKLTEMYESAAHKYLDSYKYFGQEELESLSQSFLSVAQRIAGSQKLMDQFMEQQRLINTLTFCERLSLKLQEKPEEKTKAKKSAQLRSR